MAVTECLQYISTLHTQTPFHLYTDCLSLLRELASLNDNDEGVIAIKNILYQFQTQGIFFRLFHVPGHKGILGNELADRLATSAMRFGSERMATYSIRTVRSELYKIMVSHWHAYWQTEGPNTSLFHWINSVYKIPKWFPPNRKLTHLMTGHGHFQYYLKRFNITMSDRCACTKICVADLHYFNDCPRTQHVTQHLRSRTDPTISHAHFPRYLLEKKKRVHT